MDNNTIINKVLEKYKNHNLTEAEVKLLISLAGSFGVPQGAIYPGILMILNNQYGIEDNESLFTDAMRALTADALLKTMNNK